MADLNADQAYRVERVLRRRANVTCPKCGSADYLASNGVWMRNISGETIVGVYCVNRSAKDHPQEMSPSPRLSDEEAPQVGIPVRGRVPRRTSGTGTS
jgi:uncharacterized lipoprotein NlpE involved in copper resistance